MCASSSEMSAQDNFHVVHSANQFQDLLSADLERVSVTNFWAPWAEPCKMMNDIVEELSKKYPKVLFLQVEAEEQSDIAESFEIEAVPTSIVLRGHRLLSRISGADAEALKVAVEIHARKLTNAPLSHTDKPPAKPADEKVQPLEEEETKEELDARLRRLMNEDKVVLFMKGSPDTPQCGFSRKIVALLNDGGIKFTHFDILTDESVRQGLKVLNDWPTFPQLIVKGELVGGLDIVKEMAESGELKRVVNQ